MIRRDHLTDRATGRVADEVRGRDAERDHEAQRVVGHLLDRGRAGEAGAGAEAAQVVILGAGRNNTQAIIDFVRRRTGLDEKMKAAKAEDTPELALA